MYFDLEEAGNKLTIYGSRYLRHMLVLANGPGDAILEDACMLRDSIASVGNMLMDLESIYHYQLFNRRFYLRFILRINTLSSLLIRLEQKYGRQ